MKSYAVYDEQLELTDPIGYLLYYEKSKSFIIELSSDLDEWQAPLLFQGLVRKGIYTIPKEVSLMWVRERIIPSGRQNIGEILRTHKLKEYSEIAMLTLSKGRSSQDDCYLKEVREEEIPESIKNRWSGNVEECFPTEQGDIVCLFCDNTARLIRLEKLVDKYRSVTHIMKRRELLKSVEVGVGGYSISFNESIEVSASDLKEYGELLPLQAPRIFHKISLSLVVIVDLSFTRKNAMLLLSI
jgi:hypothetical protein